MSTAARVHNHKYPVPRTMRIQKTGRMDENAPDAMAPSPLASQQTATRLEESPPKTSVERTTKRVKRQKFETRNAQLRRNCTASRKTDSSALDLFS